MTAQYDDSTIDKAIEKAMRDHDARAAASNPTAAHPFMPFPQGTIGRDTNQCQQCAFSESLHEANPTAGDGECYSAECAYQLKHVCGREAEPPAPSTPSDSGAATAQGVDFVLTINRHPDGGLDGRPRVTADAGGYVCEGFRSEYSATRLAEMVRRANNFDPLVEVLATAESLNNLQHAGISGEEMALAWADLYAQCQKARAVLAQQ